MGILAEAWYNYLLQLCAWQPCVRVNHIKEEENFIKFNRVKKCFKKIKHMSLDIGTKVAWLEEKSKKQMW